MQKVMCLIEKTLSWSVFCFCKVGGRQMWIFTTILKKIEDLRATHNHPNFDFDHINKLMANASKLYVEAGNETPETIKNQNKELASWLERWS